MNNKIIIFENQNIKLELPDFPNLEDINVNRLSKKRDEKILEEIIKPKDNLIKDLYQDNLILQQELSRQARMVEKAEKYQKGRDSIIDDNQNLHNEVEQIKLEYKQKEKGMGIGIVESKMQVTIIKVRKIIKKPCIYMCGMVK